VVIKIKYYLFFEQVYSLELSARSFLTASEWRAKRINISKDL